LRNASELEFGNLRESRRSCLILPSMNAVAVKYVTDHYVYYTSVLVRLSRVNADVLRDLLGMACKFVTRKAARRSSAPKRRMLGPGKSAVTGDVEC
jgi:hypothetical protein